MIIARIDNEITARTPFRRGRSFKGAISYLLEGDRDDPNPERVVHAETVNIWSDLRDAAHEMAETWTNRFHLMSALGLMPKNGADNKAPVYHLVMSWSPDEEAPPPKEMADYAKQLLVLLGLGEHEAVVVVHGDTANPHVHIIANSVHPITGRTAALRYDKRIMQDFAARYEELRGKIVCEGRFTKDAKGEFKRAAGRSFSGRRASRPRWERDLRAAIETKRASLPAIILEQLTLHHSTFTPAQLSQAVTASTATPKEFAELTARILASPDLVRLDDANGRIRYTTRVQQAAEQRLAENAATLAGSIRHGVTTAALAGGLQKFVGPEQACTREALAHLLDERGLSMVVGYAGAGKSTLLRSAAEAWTGSGFKPRGLALAGRAAEGLEADAGISSGTIAGFLMAADRGAIALGPKDIVVIDEAGMVGSRQLDRVLDIVRRAGAKAVLVGDPEQLQAIEAGGAFRYLVEHYDHARLSTIWRQKEVWMREATRALAEGQTGDAVAAYEAAGMVHGHADTDEAVTAILDQWQAGRDRGGSQLILTATNADARAINMAARDRLKAAGALGIDHEFATADGPAAFATGDRILFRRNDSTLKVKNGTTGTVFEITGGRMMVAVDGRPPRIVAVDPAQYPHIDHGYAVTIHKSQGATVDRTYVLASRFMDRHAAYVALSRHRERVSLHWSREDFADNAALVRQLGRARLKDVTLDYKSAIAESIREIMDAAKTPDASRREVRLWTSLYAEQRREADALAAMSTLRRAFWMAGNLARFVRAGVVTLARLHERERAELARSLQSSRRDRASRAARSANASDILMAGTAKAKSDAKLQTRRPAAPSAQAPRRPE